MIRRFKVGYDVELHKRTLERGLLSLIGPDAAASPAAERTRATAEHANAPVEIDGIAALAVRTDVGVDLLCDAARHRRCSAALRRARRGAGLRAGRRVPARRARPPPLRDRPRRQRHPPGGRAERARGQLHEGLLRRPGDGRAPATTRASPTATCAGCACPRRPRRARSCCSASGPSAASAASPLSPRLGPDRARARAPRGRAGRTRERRRARRERRGPRAAVSAPERSSLGALDAGVVLGDGLRSCRCLRIAASCALTASGCGGVSSVLITFGPFSGSVVGSMLTRAP